MNEDEAKHHLLTQRNIVEMMKWVIRLKCRHEAVKALLVAKLAEGDAEQFAKISTAIETAAKDEEEKLLLTIGDTNPVGAELLDVQAFLKRIESDEK